MPKFVCVTANKAECEAENASKGRLRMNHDKTPLAPANPPRVKPDPFAPKKKGVVEPRLIKSPVASSVRGDAKPASEPSNAEIMAFLLKNFPAAK